MHKSILRKCNIKKILTRLIAAAAVVTLTAGQSIMYAPTVYAVEQKTQANEITQEKAFYDEKTIDGYKVVLLADDGIFPDGTTVSINKVSSDRNQSIKQIIESKIDSEQSITKLVTFDFEFKDPSGNIIEPENGTVSVSVGIAGEVKEAVDNAVTPSVQVYHIDESDKAEQVISNTSNDQVSFHAASFSEYTIVITDGVISGKCGENIEWKLTPEDKVLTITGTGEMEAAPWGNYNKNVKKIVISEGITTIADNAFNGCENAEGTLELPTTLEKIGDYAFQYCSKLSGNLVLPENVEKIGNHAFYRCTGLTGKLIIPSKVTRIGIYAFGNCTGFEGDLVIPEGVKEIDVYAFGYCTGITGTVTIPSSVTEMFHIISGCTNVRKVINNSNLPITLPTDYYDLDTWIDNSNPQYQINSITNGTAIKKCTVRFISDGNVVSEQSLIAGNNVAKPSNPVNGNKRFIGWYTTRYANADSKPYDFNQPVSTGMVLYAIWKNVYNVNYIVDGKTELTQEVLEGDKLSLPTNISKNGYTLDGWYYNESCTSKYRENTYGIYRSFNLYGKWIANANSGGESTDDVISDNDTSDSTESNPVDTKPVEVKVDSSDKANIEKTIKQVAAGSTITVNMSDTKSVSKDVLEAAKGKDIDVVLDMGGYTWTINGTQISGENLKDIDMSVSFGNKNIPDGDISSVAKNNQYQTISLNYDGPFGFTASLGFNVGKNNAGKYVNLYYYTDKNELEYQNTGMVDENGETKLVFTHASEYVAVISDAKPAGTILTSDSPKTGDDSNVLLFVVLMCAVLVMSFGFVRKKSNCYLSSF